MPHDPELVKETTAWFLKAHHDIRAAEILLSVDNSLHDHTEPSEDETKAALKISKELFSALLARLPKDIEVLSE